MHRISILVQDGRSSSVVVAGEGPLLMLLHGFPLDHRLWTGQLESLAAKYQVVCPEFRGFGGSTLEESEYSLEDLAGDVEVVRRHFAPSDPMILAGLSMGGYVAFEYWSRYAANLSQLLLVNTKPSADDETAIAGRLKMAEVARQEGTAIAIHGMVDKLVSKSTNAELRSQAERMMLSTSPAALAAAQVAMSRRRDFVSRLPEIQVPTLVITGDDDPLCPPKATQAWASMLPNAKFQSIADAGHLSPLEKPDEFNALLLNLT